MIMQINTSQPDSISLFRAIAYGLLVGFACLIAESASAAEEVGRVVVVRGEAFAQAPGEEKRILHCDSPIYPEDRITTGDGASLGILADAHYARVGEKSEFTFGRGRAGAPDLGLQNGHIRLLEMDSDAAPAAIRTPGLEVADAGSDTEALVFTEKVYVVSMICPANEELSISRFGDPLQLIRSLAGSCAVGKPNEPLYSAVASHPKLDLLAADSCGPIGDVAAGNVSDRFTPFSVAAMLPPPPPIVQAPAISALSADPVSACTAQGCVVPDGLRSDPALPVGQPGS